MSIRGSTAILSVVKLNLFIPFFGGVTTERYLCMRKDQLITIANPLDEVYKGKATCSIYETRAMSKTKYIGALGQLLTKKFKFV